MTIRMCWTCNTEHDLDAACSASAAVRSMRSAGAPGNEFADHTSPDLFDDAAPLSKLGPVFTATYVSEDACCGDGIGVGDEIRSDGQGGWIHASEACERLVRE
jgi:hypothetical protein